MILTIFKVLSMLREHYIQIKKRIFIWSAEQTRKFRSPEKYKSLEFLCAYLEPEDAHLNEYAEVIKHKIISQVCTWNLPYLPKDNICLLMKEENADEVIKKGAAVLICKRSIKDYPCIVTSNPVLSFASLCKYFRNLQQKVSITAVTGSIGKTTIKNMIGCVYKMKYNTYCNEGNFNSKGMIGFVAQHIPDKTEKMVQEIHEGEPGETQYLSKILHPDLFAITTIDKSHFMYFGDVNKIVEEVCSVTKYMSESGSVIVNIDEFNRFDLLNRRKIITVSALGNDADFCVQDVEVDTEGLIFFVFVKKESQRYLVRLNNIYAPHNATCALYAFAAGYHEGIAPKDIVKGLSGYKTKGSRQNIVKTDDGIILYADCYNAVARSMKSAMDTCDAMTVKGKRIAVLGDVEESGSLSDSTHIEIMEYANASKFDILLTIGDKLKKAIPRVKQRESLEIHSFYTLEELSNYLKKISSVGDLVLLKASHASKLSQCIKINWPESFKRMDFSDLAFDKFMHEILPY